MQQPPCPVPSPRAQERLVSALSPKNGLGVPLGMVWQCQGTEEVVGAQPASVSSCPSLCPYPCVHADLAHLEVYPCFPVHVCTRVHPLPTIVCAPTPWVCTPKHPPLHPRAHGQGWHGCAKGCCYPRQRLGCLSPATPSAVLGQGVSRAGTGGFIGVTAQEKP